MAKVLQFTPKSPIQKALDSKLNFQKKVIPIKKEDVKVNPRVTPNQTYA